MKGKNIPGETQTPVNNHVIESLPYFLQVFKKKP